MLAVLPRAGNGTSRESDFRHREVMTAGPCSAGVRSRDWSHFHEDPTMRLPTVALSTLALLLALPAHAGDLTVQLTDIRATTGLVTLALVDAAGYAGRARPVQATGGPVAGDTQTFVFAGVAPGRYAVMVTHDENGNGRLDTNMLGMPTEGYGFSNNPRVMRKPTFDEAAFDVGADAATITIELR